MKYISYSLGEKESIGFLIDDNKNVVDIPEFSKGKLPDNMLDFLKDFHSNHLWIKKNIDANKSKCIYDLNLVNIVAPIKNPRSFRDAYAFRKHVEIGRRNRGLKMIPEYDKFPVFYFSNHNSIKGPGDIDVQKKHLEKLDFELEIGILIAKEGRNIKSKDAYEYVAGLVVMNDWSARKIQFEEMKLNLGPAKGKDFATSIGPYLVTLDTLKKYFVKMKNGFTYNLNMQAFINGNLVSSDNMQNMTWSFSEIIERASYGTDLFPGDLIGSGTCASGCLLEINQSKTDEFWLQDGDIVTLKIDNLGVLENTINLISH